MSDPGRITESLEYVASSLCVCLPETEIYEGSVASRCSVWRLPPKQSVLQEGCYCRVRCAPCFGSVASTHEEVAIVHCREAAKVLCCQIGRLVFSLCQAQLTVHCCIQALWTSRTCSGCLGESNRCCRIRGGKQCVRYTPTYLYTCV